MSIAKRIIDALKDVKWEEKSQSEIDAKKLEFAALKISVPLLVPVAKHFLRNELTGPGGHAKDELAKRMFDHYLDEDGKLFVLTLDDMKAMNANGIDIRNKDTSTVNPDFAVACSKAKAAGTAQDYSGKLHWVWDNGSIANYTVHYAGQITAAGGVCKWEGVVDYFDRFDLDPRWGWTPSNPQGRSRGGERRTRIGYILDLGTDYDVKSPKARTWQRETDKAITFDGTIVAGSTPTAPSAGDL